MVDYVRQHPEIHDVIVSGGDPLSLPISKLRWFVNVSNHAVLLKGVNDSVPVMRELMRTAEGWRQRVAAYLGELTSAGQNGWATLGSHLNGEAKPGQPQLTLSDPPRPKPHPSPIANVRPL